MSADPDTLETLTLDGVALALITHLDEEAGALADALAVLQVLNKSLRLAEYDDFESIRARQQSIAVQLDALRLARRDLMRTAAAILRRRPEELTLRAILPHLPADLARHLDACRERTRVLALQVDALNRRNALLTGQGLAFVRERLEGMCAVSPTGRYGATGKAVAAPRGSFFHVQG